MRKIAIIAETKDKLQTECSVEAIKLFTSQTFRLALQYIQHRGIGKRDTYIITKYGLLPAGKKLMPYETSLSELKEAWVDQVVKDFERQFPNKEAVEFEIHAGKTYTSEVVQKLQEKGYTVNIPLPNLSLGQKLKWYKANLTGHNVNIAFMMYNTPKNTVKAQLSITREMVHLAKKDVSIEGLERLYKALTVISDKKELSELLADHIRNLRDSIKKQRTLARDIKQLQEKLEERLKKDPESKNLFTEYKRLSESCFAGENSFDEFAILYAKFKEKARPVLKLYESIGELEGYMFENEREITCLLNNLSKQLLKAA